MLALLDNTVLSNFTCIRRPELVAKVLGQDAATREAAWSELQTGMRSGRLPTVGWSWLRVLPLHESEAGLYRRFTESLNAGEAACLAIAVVRKCRIFTDDRDARRLAAQLQIPTSGTLGILLRLVDTKAVSLAEGDRMLAAMVAANYRSPVVSLRELL